MDREKVIKGQECCQISMSEENPFEKCEECPYNHIGISVQDCRSVLSGNTLELLKEQEAVEPFHKCSGKDFTLIEDSHFDYCPYCGKSITWKKQEGR